VKPAVRAALLLTLAAPLAIPSLARADDSPAVVELKAGYALKQSGDCREALPHLLASYQFDAKPKAILNASDCEQRLGDLVTAEKYAREGLDLATREGDAELAAVARDQLMSVERRVGHLAVVLAGGAAATVAIDGVTVVSLPGPVVLNPGPHQIVVHAAGYADQSYAVTLGEGERQRIEVTAGEALVAEEARTDSAQSIPQRIATTNEGPTPPATSAISTRQMIGLTLGGAGLVTVIIGSVFGLNAISKNSESNAGGHCDSTGCDPTGVSLRNAALSDATISTVLFGAAFAAISGGVALYLTGPTPTTAVHAHLNLAPVLGRSAGGLGLRGTW
jgi:hypothetical protein